MLRKFYFSLSSVVSRAFSVLCVYSKFGHHPHPLGYLCAIFVSVAPSIAELAREEKSCTQSINHSPSLFDVLGTTAFASELLAAYKHCTSGIQKCLNTKGTT